LFRDENSIPFYPHTFRWEIKVSRSFLSRQDKDGKPLDLSVRDNATPKAAAPTTAPIPPPSSDAGQKMLEFALSRVHGKAAAPPTAPPTTTAPTDVAPEGTKVDTAPTAVASEEPPAVAAPSSLQQVLSVEVEPTPAAAATALFRVYTKEILLRYVRALWRCCMILE
jgi:hypothetical protein